MVNDQLSKDLSTIRRFLRLQFRGVGLKKTFETLELHERGKTKQVIQGMRSQLEQGRPLAEVFAELVRDPRMREMLVTAERGHHFLEGLEQVLVLTTMRRNLRQEMKQLARYPLVILTMLLGLGGIYALYIFPKLLTMVDIEALEGMNAILLSKWFFPSLFIGLLMIGASLYWNGRHGRVIPLRFIERGRRLYVTYLFVSELALLSEGQGSVREIIERLGRGDGEVAAIARRMHENMSGGMELEAAARFESLLDHEVVSLFGVGTVSGELGSMMAMHRDLLFEEMEVYWKQLIAKTEPVLYGFLTVMVTMIFYTIYLPVKLIMSQL
ncbi:type II secretion system F family protein [Exiguobacterium sp. AM39-5BH]|uniref:type II secretion system F family protein n=1 Tax=Exiguobacterium sp. AM39-5BH TaxID=2292355 RepID=UPI000FE27939|nr:type II secretion system F family protein [Exiguobacterium sp. AM39-5BH]RHB51855.1 type II secretion system protein [Exiguobacterium sp. AM39-5BH]